MVWKCKTPTKPGSITIFEEFVEIKVIVGEKTDGWGLTQEVEFRKAANVLKLSKVGEHIETLRKKSIKYMNKMG